MPSIPDTAFTSVDTRGRAERLRAVARWCAPVLGTSAAAAALVPVAPMTTVPAPVLLLLPLVAYGLGRVGSGASGRPDALSGPESGAALVAPHVRDAITDDRRELPQGD